MRRQRRDLAKRFNADARLFGIVIQRHRIHCVSIVFAYFSYPHSNCRIFLSICAANNCSNICVIIILYIIHHCNNSIRMIIIVYIIHHCNNSIRVIIIRFIIHIIMYIIHRCNNSYTTNSSSCINRRITYQG